MKNKLPIMLFLVVVIVVHFLGQAQLVADYDSQSKIFDSEFAQYKAAKNQHKQDSIGLRKTTPPKDGLKYNRNSIPGSYDQPYLNASQGIEAHLAGLEWKGHIVEGETLNKMKKNFGGRYVNSISHIHFDPDFEDSGYPDLMVEVNRAPTIYHIGMISQSLSKILKVERPVDTYDLETSNGTRARMQLWLVQFDMTFRIEPTDQHDRNREYDFDGRHPITREKASDLRGRREMNDQRYGGMNVLLEFKPKAGSWFIADTDENGIYQPNSNPSIGISAVECLEIAKVGEGGTNNSATRIGVTLNQGKSLPLYNSLDDLKKLLDSDYKSSELLSTVDEQTIPYSKLYENDGNPVLVNPSLFNQSKFSLIPIQNLGSWKENQSWPLGKKVYHADAFTASFLVHLYVFGEWAVKPTAFTKFEARPPVKIEKPGILDRLLPDFKIGFFGKIISVVVLVAGGFLILSIFFPPAFRIVMSLLRRMIPKDTSS